MSWARPAPLLTARAARSAAPTVPSALPRNGAPDKGPLARCVVPQHGASLRVLRNATHNRYTMCAFVFPAPDGGGGFDGNLTHAPCLRLHTWRPRRAPSTSPLLLVVPVDACSTGRAYVCAALVCRGCICVVDQVCSGHGSCVGQKAYCSCYTGYTGASCSACESGYMPVVRAGSGARACVFLPGALATCSDGKRNGEEEGVDCGGPTCPASCSASLGTLKLKSTFPWSRTVCHGVRLGDDASEPPPHPPPTGHGPNFEVPP